jgi:hypothetical protein
LKSAIAVIMAAMMMLLASCGQAEDVSAEGDNRLTRAEEEKENAETTAKEDTAKPAGEETGEEAGDTPADETTTNAETSTDIKYFPDKAFLYDKYIIDAVTGEILLTTDEIDNYSNFDGDVSFEKNLLKFTTGTGNSRYIDLNGKEVTDLLTNGYTVFRDDSSNYGVKDKNGNIVIEPMYSSLDGFRDNTYFTFHLKNAYGILNEKAEVIFMDNSYVNADFYSENFVTKNSLYSLPSGELIGQYDRVYNLGNNTFLVTGKDENYNEYAKIIDNKGNLIADLLSDTPFPSDQIKKAFCEEDHFNINFNEMNKMPIFNFYLTNYDESYFGLFNNKGENIEGWIEAYTGRDYDIYYNNDNILTTLETYDVDSSVLTERSINTYDYNGKLIATGLKNVSPVNGKVFQDLDSMTTYINSEGVKIGEFSSDNVTGNKLNAVIVTDIDKMFKGVIIGDELKYPCEYISIEFVKSYDKYPRMLMLQKANETIYITAETGAIVDLPQ